MDEFQKVKNNSDQYKACKTIIYAIVSSGMSRYALLSGSPFDKEEHVINNMKMLGIIKSPKLFVHHKESDDLRLYGAQEAIDYCGAIDPEQTEATLADYTLNSKNVPGLCFRLFIDVIAKHITSSMPPLSLSVNKDVANGYYNMSEEEGNELNRAVGDLSTATRFNEASGSIDNREVN